MHTAKTVAKDTLRVVTPLLVGFLLYLGALAAGPRTFRRTWFFDIGPGSSPPWYFIGQDAVEGAWAAGGFLFLCVFTILAAGHFGSVVWAAFAMNAVSFASRTGLGVNASFHTSQIWNRSLASTSWKTFDEYLASQRQASDVSLAVGAALAAGGLALYVRALRREMPAGRA